MQKEAGASRREPALLESLSLKFCNPTPGFRAKTQPVQHPLSPPPAPASQPGSCLRMSRIFREASPEPAPGSILFPEHWDRAPERQEWPVNHPLEGKIRFSARLRAERKALAEIPPPNQTGESRSPALSARHRPRATGAMSPTLRPLSHAWPGSPATPSSLLAARGVWLQLGSPEGSHTGPDRAPPVLWSKDAPRQRLRRAASLLLRHKYPSSPPPPRPPSRGVKASFSSLLVGDKIK